MQLLIDNRGTLHANKDCAQRNYLWSQQSRPAPLPNTSLTDGTIRIDQHRNQDILWLNPNTVTDLAFGRLAEWLDVERQTGLVLQIYSETTCKWTTILSRRHRRTITILADIILAAAAKNNQRVLVQDFSPNISGTHSRLHAVIQSWTSINGDAGTAFINYAGRKILRGRYTLFKIDTEQAVFRLKEIGHGKPSTTKSYLSPIIGQPVQLQHDIWFGRSCAEQFQRAYQLQRPLTQAVDALIDWPGQSATSHRYFRVMILVQIAGEPNLLSGTIEDPSINLRQNFA